MARDLAKWLKHLPEIWVPGIGHGHGHEHKVMSLVPGTKRKRAKFQYHAKSSGFMLIQYLDKLRSIRTLCSRLRLECKVVL